jgi:hypothetical protein
MGIIAVIWRWHTKASAILAKLLTWAANRFVVAGIAAFAIAATSMASPARAAEPDGITRLIGLEMLRVRMLEQRAIDAQPAGHQGVGYDVRIG